MRLVPYIASSRGLQNSNQQMSVSYFLCRFVGNGLHFGGNHPADIQGTTALICFFFDVILITRD